MEIAERSKAKDTAANNQLMDSLPVAQQEQCPPASNMKLQGFEVESQTTSLTFDFTAINFDRKCLKKKNRAFADVELMNASSEWVAYKESDLSILVVKWELLNHLVAAIDTVDNRAWDLWDVETIDTQSSRVDEEPGERYNLQLIVQPQSLDALGRNFLLFETFFLGGGDANDQDYASSFAGDLDVVRLWETALESDLTKTKLSVTFKPFTNREKEIVERYVVHFDRFPDQIEKSRLDRYRKIFEQLKREKIAKLTSLFLIGLFLVGCFFGDLYEMDDQILDII